MDIIIFAYEIIIALFGDVKIIDITGFRYALIFFDNQQYLTYTIGHYLLLLLQLLFE